MMKVGVLVLCVAASSEAQQTAKPPSPIHPDAPKAAAIVKLSPTTFRIGEMTIDTAAKTLSISATVNEVTTLEFVANTLNGAKAYESALTLNTNAVSFNAALLLLGLDPARSKPSKMQFDRWLQRVTRWNSPSHGVMAGANRSDRGPAVRPTR